MQVGEQTKSIVQFLCAEMHAINQHCANNTSICPLFIRQRLQVAEKQLKILEVSQYNDEVHQEPELLYCMQVTSGFQHFNKHGSKPKRKLPNSYMHNGKNMI